MKWSRLPYISIDSAPVITKVNIYCMFFGESINNLIGGLWCPGSSLTKYLSLFPKLDKKMLTSCIPGSPGLLSLLGPSASIVSHGAPSAWFSNTSQGSPSILTAAKQASIRILQIWRQLTFSGHRACSWRVGPCCLFSLGHVVVTGLILLVFCIPQQG